MTGKGVEEFALGEVVLVELRGQLNEVAVDICARKRRILGVGEQTVKRMAELVQECLNLVGGE